ncbi:MAG: hypothetical protein K2Q32_03130, partial [Alphaproteobacteria bacterium]|nr:hypothetical protein [Alphaproteobacteria bacterium]
SGYRYNKTIRNKNGVFCMQFKKGRNIVYVAWTTGKTPATYELALPDGQWETKPLMGEANTVNSSNNTAVTLQLQSMPLIVKSVSD